jgi:hypothetical protein
VPSRLTLPTLSTSSSFAMSSTCKKMPGRSGKMRRRRCSQECGSRDDVAGVAFGETRESSTAGRVRGEQLAERDSADTRSARRRSARRRRCADRGPARRGALRRGMPRTAAACTFVARAARFPTAPSPWRETRLIRVANCIDELATLISHRAKPTYWLAREPGKTTEITRRCLERTAIWGIPA